jgi:putative aldouronate transport system permease protein
VLREILISQDIDDIMAGAVEEAEPIAETIKYAIIVVATVPILLIYPFVQKYFVKGVMIGALKG